VRAHVPSVANHGSGQVGRLLDVAAHGSVAGVQPPDVLWFGEVLVAAGELQFFKVAPRERRVDDEVELPVVDEHLKFVPSLVFVVQVESSRDQRSRCENSGRVNGGRMPIARPGMMSSGQFHIGGWVPGNGDGWLLGKDYNCQ